MGVIGTPGWLLAVDFGTSNTAAADVADGSGVVRTVPLSQQSVLMPSVVHVSSADQIDVGEVARNRVADDPGGVVADPKWQLTLGRDTCRVGLLDVPVRSVIAAVLRTAVSRAQVRHRGLPPSRLVLTYPQQWSPDQVEVMVAAATEIGLPESMVWTVPESVAAMHHYAQTVEVQTGDRLAVVDFGGGSLDVTVFVVAPNGLFQVLAAQSDDSLCGRNFDAKIRQWVSMRLARVNPQLHAGLAEGEASALDLLAFDDSVRRAKELLSETAMANIDVRVGDLSERLVLTSRDFERLVAPDIERAVRFAYATLESAGIRSQGELTAIYLTGGSSRIPTMRHRLEEIGPVAVLDEVETAVAQGALLAVSAPAVAEPVMPRADAALVAAPRQHSARHSVGRLPRNPWMPAGVVAGGVFAAVLAAAIVWSLAHGRPAAALPDAAVGTVASATSVGPGDSTTAASPAPPTGSAPGPVDADSASVTADSADAGSSADPVCVGLAGDLVTPDSPGNQDAPTQLAAAVMYARYVRRDPAALMALYATAPSAVQVNTVIGQAPVGTRYCVAASMIGPRLMRVVFQQQYPGMAISPPQTETWTISGSAPYRVDRVSS